MKSVASSMRANARMISPTRFSGSSLLTARNEKPDASGSPTAGTSPLGTEIGMIVTGASPVPYLSESERAMRCDTARMPSAFGSTVPASSTRSRFRMRMRRPEAWTNADARKSVWICTWSFASVPRAAHRAASPCSNGSCADTTSIPFSRMTRFAARASAKGASSRGARTPYRCSPSSCASLAIAARETI